MIVSYILDATSCAIGGMISSSLVYFYHSCEHLISYDSKGSYIRRYKKDLVSWFFIDLLDNNIIDPKQMPFPEVLPSYHRKLILTSFVPGCAVGFLLERSILEVLGSIKNSYKGEEDFFVFD